MTIAAQNTETRSAGRSFGEAFHAIGEPLAKVLAEARRVILAQADPGPGEKVVVAPVDIAALRAPTRRRAHARRPPMAGVCALARGQARGGPGAMRIWGKMKAGGARQG